MYNELYEAWKKEKENAEIQKLSKDFYTKLNEYLRKAKEESRMLDEKTLKAKILIHEAKNVRSMVNELVSLRQQKIVRTILTGETIPTDNLPQEEEKITKSMAPPFESFQELLKEVLGGRLQQASNTSKPKKRVLRFLKETPAIIGADMKAYGPFKPEDVASIPQENAKILVKQGVAVEIEVKL
jgi:DNA replication factor GINS